MKREISKDAMKLLVYLAQEYRVRRRMYNTYKTVSDVSLQLEESMTQAWNTFKKAKSLIYYNRSLFRATTVRKFYGKS